MNEKFNKNQLGLAPGEDSNLSASELEDTFESLHSVMRKRKTSEQRDKEHRDLTNMRIAMKVQHLKTARVEGRRRQHLLGLDNSGEQETIETQKSLPVFEPCTPEQQKERVVLETKSSFHAEEERKRERRLQRYMDAMRKYEEKQERIEQERKLAEELERTRKQEEYEREQEEAGVPMGRFLVKTVSIQPPRGRY